MDIVLAALCGFLMDLALGDPAWMPHPVVGMGKCIAALERGLRRVFRKTPRGELAAGAVLAAFAGALLVIKPSGSNLSLLPAAVGLLGGFGAGVAYTMVRVLGKRGVPGPFIVFTFSAFSCLATLPPMLLSFSPMTAAQWGMLLLAGASAAAAQFAVTAAYRCAPAREISVFDYSQIVFSALWGFLVFGQVPDALSWLGYAVICGTAVANFLHTVKKAA